MVLNVSLKPLIMRTITPHFKLITLIIPVFMLFSITKTYSQTIIIDSTFSSDAEIFPFSSIDTIYGLSISGSVVLLTDTSLVRVILSDDSGNEWMICEWYPYLSSEWQFDLTQFADETKYIIVLHPSSVKIHLVQASLSIQSLTL